jgi:prophage regulatory protein
MRYHWNGEVDQTGRLIVDSEFLNSNDLEAWTGTRASTWRYWASIGAGPASFKLGRRRVWRRSTVLEWLAAQEVTAKA